MTINRPPSAQLALFIATVLGSTPDVGLAQELGTSNEGLTEVIVTAQRREDKLQETPIAVTAFGEAELRIRNVENVANIAEFTPGLIFDETAPLSGATPAAVVYIRGVGQSSYQVSRFPSSRLSLRALGTHRLRRREISNSQPSM